MNIQKMLDNLKLVDDKLDVEGFSGIGPCRTAIAEVGAFLQQLLNKRDVVRCKELLELRLSKEQELADINSHIDLRESGQNYRNIEKIRMAMMLIEELPAL